MAAWPSAAPLRFPGVLQRIALSYAIAAAVVLYLNVSEWIVAAAVLLLGHWALLAMVPFGGYHGGTLTPEHNLARYVDTFVFGRHALTIPNDPEGLLGTLSAAATALIGALTADFIRRSRNDAERLRTLVRRRARPSSAAGLAWSRVLPLSKPLWTGSFVFVVSGLAMLFFAVIYALVDVGRLRWWSRPFLWLASIRWRSTSCRKSPGMRSRPRGCGSQADARRRRRRSSGACSSRRCGPPRTNGRRSCSASGSLRCGSWLPASSISAAFGSRCNESIILARRRVPGGGRAWNSTLIRYRRGVTSRRDLSSRRPWPDAAPDPSENAAARRHWRGAAPLAAVDGTRDGVRLRRGRVRVRVRRRHGLRRPRRRGPWFLLAAVLVGMALRAVDIEGAALFIPGGLYGAAKQAFGRRASKAAAAVLVVEHMLFGALAAAAAGRALGAIGAPLRLVVPSLPVTALDDLSTATAVVVIGAVALWLRQGELLPQKAVIRTVGTFVAMTVLLAAWAALTAVWRRDASPLVASLHALRGLSIPGALSAAGGCLFAMGTFEALSRAADFPQPKIANLRRTARLVNAFALLVVAGSAFLFALLVPAGVRDAWRDVPLSAFAWFGGAPRPIGLLLGLSIAVASVAFLCLAVHRSATNAQQLLLRLSEDGLVPQALRALHPRFGTPSRSHPPRGDRAADDLPARCGRRGGSPAPTRSCWPAARSARSRRWFGYGRSARSRGRFAWASTSRCSEASGRSADDPGRRGGGSGGTADRDRRRGRRDRRRHGGRVHGDVQRRRAHGARVGAGGRGADAALRSPPVAGDGHRQVDVRPGNLLVPIRRPGALAHLGTALQHAGDRDVVVMTVRIVGVDASDEMAVRPETTDQERRLLNEAAMLAERIWARRPPVDCPGRKRLRCGLRKASSGCALRRSTSANRRR